MDALHPTNSSPYRSQLKCHLLQEAFLDCPEVVTVYPITLFISATAQFPYHSFILKTRLPKFKSWLYYL